MDFSYLQSYNKHAYEDAPTSLIFFAQTCNNSVRDTFVMNTAQAHTAIWLILYIISSHAPQTCSLHSQREHVFEMGAMLY
jgi:hypothetical protein